jgi:hypothetical protein
VTQMGFDTEETHLGILAAELLSVNAHLEEFHCLQQHHHQQQLTFSAQVMQQPQRQTPQQQQITLNTTTFQ